MLVAGCGGRADGEGGSASAIRELDEPAPAAWVAVLRSLPRELEGVTGEEAEGKKRVLLATVPADDSEPRVIASVPVASTEMRVVAWRARTGRLCISAFVGPYEKDLGGIYPAGPCFIGDPCRQLCVEQAQVELAGERTVVAGLVSAEADELALASLYGDVTTFVLDGPLVPEHEEWRVFAADLGRRSYGVAELYRAGKRIDRRNSSEYDYETKDCIEQAMRENRDESECL